VYTWRVTAGARDSGDVYGRNPKSRSLDREDPDLGLVLEAVASFADEIADLYRTGGSIYHGDVKLRHCRRRDDWSGEAPSVSLHVDYPPVLSVRTGQEGVSYEAVQAVFRSFGGMAQLAFGSGPEPELPWEGQVYRDRATGRELMRNTDAAIQHEVGAPITIQGKPYRIAAIDGDDVLLEPA
jgi:hypothetical protein